MTIPRTVTRRLNHHVEFHHVDMMQVVHNFIYLKWFEKGRFQLLDEVFPVSWMLENRIATPVVMNHAEYLNSATYGDTLVVTTRHRVKDYWDGRFLFKHSISNAKTKLELCSGETATTVIDFDSKQLLKEIPEEIWSRYQNLE